MMRSKIRTWTDEEDARLKTLVEQGASARRASVAFPFEGPTMKKAVLALSCSLYLQPHLAQSVGEKPVSIRCWASRRRPRIYQGSGDERSHRDRGRKARAAKRECEEKKVAEMMIADHTKTSDELKSMVPDNLKAALPTALDDAS
jgi:putative membrane protein